MKIFLGDSKCLMKIKIFFILQGKTHSFYNFYTTFSLYIQRVQFYLFNFFYNTIYIITLYDNRNIYTPHVINFCFHSCVFIFIQRYSTYIKYFKIVQSSSEYIPLINIIPCVTPAPKVHLKSLSLSTGL